MRARACVCARVGVCAGARPRARARAFVRESASAPQRDAQSQRRGDDANERLDRGPDARFAARESKGPEQADENTDFGDNESAQVEDAENLAFAENRLEDSLDLAVDTAGSFALCSV